MESPTTFRGWRVMTAFLFLLAGMGQNPLAAQDATGKQMLSNSVIHELALESPVLPANYHERANGPGTIIAGDVINAGFDVGCDSCGGGGCDVCTLVCGPRCSSGLWVRADYLLWWEKGSNLIALATTSTGNPAAADIGVLGVSTTKVLFGGHVNDSPLSGYRLELGSWLDPNNTVGLFGRYFTAGDREIGFSANPNSLRYLARPFFNLASDAEDAILLTNPGDREGSIDIHFDGRANGWELLLRSCAYVGCNYRLDLVYGYRHFELEENLVINTSSVVLPGSPGIVPVGTVTNGNDSFHTKNKFDGFDLGIAGQARDGCWSLDFLAKVALGNMRERVDINGFAVVDTPGLPLETLVGALLTQETNIGRFEQDEFAWIPELNLNIGYSVTPSLDITIGYSLIYVDKMLQLASTIDRVIDPALIADLTPLVGDRPELIVNERDYWLQGLNFGLTARF